MISILVFCLIPDPRGPPCLADALLHYSCRRAVAKLAHFLFLGVFNGSIALIQQVTEPTVGPAAKNTVKTSASGTLAGCEEQFCTARHSLRALPLSPTTVDWQLGSKQRAIPSYLVKVRD
ncbi:hypothetical protein DTO282E5_4625 [Paecilomyces variotii]|nr:hypothetical protein DTO282E5_4625 [Paecilomyces variotii]